MNSEEIAFARKTIEENGFDLSFLCDEAIEQFILCSEGTTGEELLEELHLCERDVRFARFDHERLKSARNADGVQRARGEAIRFAPGMLVSEEALFGGC